jgi:hypothetical protein
LTLTIWTPELRAELKRHCDEELRVNHRPLSARKASLLMGGKVTEKQCWTELDRWKRASGQKPVRGKRCRCGKSIFNEPHTDWRFCSDCREVISSRSRYAATTFRDGAMPHEG